MKITLFFITCSLLVPRESDSQTITPDLQDRKLWSASNRSINNVEENGKKGIKIEAGDGSNLLTLNNASFSNGTIELDLKGRNLMGQSFVGFAFHIQNDSTYDAVYFRPFNFSNPDTIRRWRAVQYISLPKYEWDKLRAEFPGKYENKVNPVPNGDHWFHCKLVIKGRQISVFVDNSSVPSLVVNKLWDTTDGKIGLWVENGSEGSFANLKINRE